MREKIIENQDLIEKWDYSKNEKEGNDPEKLTCGSSRIVWWKCSKCGYEWQTEIRTRNKGHGCPKYNHKKRKKF